MAVLYRCNCGEVCETLAELADHQPTCSEARSTGGAYREIRIAEPQWLEPAPTVWVGDDGGIL